ncbi:hypothetical protein BX616_010121 [Lobosporangium transversale]|uniref:Alpha/Beta hydrolase protein n=1 Tax=Lobosporangium transversale TaxID=64571 RepID=A0A1Y2GP38_9FUNG|nr:Alpha/Beta hydrolase protein [Lobosporangium transversale]KAF9913236.1 hypothetical protein BX616_010121 [Lobosporangium transversale]ORZ13302.1 Alpha/Beta hydrolase protein [Lobosporangium transversale]|eukprot:XP_021880383.1 Alpha/Beta hydrolase protein [Lobosporangium transversale]
MIVDHLLTRSAVRSIGLLLAAIVPLATGYFLYVLAYKETPVDTLVHNVPVFFRILQSNTSTIAELPTIASNVLSQSSSPSSLTAAAAATSMAASSRSFGVVSASAACSDSPNSEILAILSEADKVHLSPATINTLLALASFLESHGWWHHALTNVPGYHYTINALGPLRARVEPLLQHPIVASYIASHQALAWVVSLFHIWLATEILFYIHFWTRLAQAQEIDRYGKGPKTRRERKELFQRCLETIAEGDGAKTWVETWFDTGRTARPAKFEEIGRSNMMQWLAWAYWAAPIEEVFNSPTDIMDLNEMVDSLESSKGIKFSDGHNPEVECIRLAFDPVVASHRPLIYYALVWTANAIASLVFYLLGFIRFEGTSYRAHLFKNSFDKVAGNKDNMNINPATDLTYWHRSPADPKNKIPLVFIHGIGIGLAQYIHWVIALSTISRPVILIEVPYVSNKLFRSECMTPDETYFAIARILKTHEYPKATFMGHSLGTMLCAAVMRASPANSSKSIVHGLVLADPICFLTHHSIARNFAYRIPSTAAELIMDLFAAREIGTSWYIMRRFCWDQCIIFPVLWRRRASIKCGRETVLSLQGRYSPVLPKMTRVFLSRKDNLLNMDMIAEYLRKSVGLREDKQELHIMEDMDHAQFLLRPTWFFKVLKAAQEC